MMYDKERIAKIIEDIERYMRDLNQLDKKQLQDYKTYYAASMLLFVLANRAIDLGDAIVTGGELGFPGTYRNIFSLLAQNGVISKELEKRLSDLVYYRNLVSREYADVKQEDIFQFWKKITVVSDFVMRIKEYLHKKK